MLLDWEEGTCLALSCGSTSAPVCKLQSIRTVPATTVECNLKRWELGFNTGFLGTDATKKVDAMIEFEYGEINEKGFPPENTVFENPIRPSPEPSQPMEHDR